MAKSKESESGFPKIGEEITIDQAMMLCDQLGLDHLVKRISEHPEKFKEVLVIEVDESQAELFLKYAFGEFGNLKELAEANKAIGADEWEPPWIWGFGRK